MNPFPHLGCGEICRAPGPEKQERFLPMIRLSGHDP